MGLQGNGKAVLYHLEGLTYVDVVDIGRHRLAQCSNNTTQRPVIDIDMNNIINVVGQKSDDATGAGANCAMKWASYGAVAAPICDGTRRPIAKQASNKNRADRAKASNDAIITRQELQALNHKLEHDLLNNAQRTQLIEKRVVLERKVKRTETRSTNVVPPDLPSKLQAVLNRLEASKPHSVTGGYVDQVKTSWFQADALMGGRYLSGKSQLVMSNDGDMPVIFGDSCIAIKKFTGDKLTISSTSKETLEEAKSCLSEASQSKVKLVSPKHPIFEGISDLKLRALMAVVIGCDVCPSGIKSAGPHFVEKVIDDLKLELGPEVDEDAIYQKLMDAAVEKSRPKSTATTNPKYSREVLTSFVHGIIYEPTNEHPGDSEEPPVPTYLTGSDPPTLCKYLEEFKAECTAIHNGPPILKCKGSSTDTSTSHDFLAAESHHTCKKCNHIICSFCTSFIDKDNYCSSCYLNEKIMPCADSNHLPTVREMRDELKYKYGFTNVDKLRIDEIEDAWESHTLHRELEKMVDSVDFPLFPTSAIKSGEHWTDVASIDFKLGGSFLLDEKIDEQLLPGILELFSTLVKFEMNETKYTDWEKDSPVFSVLPEIYIKFASKCRAKGVGYRLLKRCLRHSFDTRMESLDNKKAKLIKYGNDVGIHITTQVPASMKDAKYDGDVVLTKDKLLSASCTCKSGSAGDEKIVCVHTLPRAFALSKLLAEDLAEHMLLELTSSLTSAMIEKDNWQDEQIQSMKSSIITLARGSGDGELAEEMVKKSSLHHCLQHFQTGTQKTKEWNRAPGAPQPSEIGPITTILSSTLAPVREAKKLFGLAPDKPDINPTEEVVPFTPDYVQICLLLNAAGIKTSDFPFVGFKLFDLRRKKQLLENPIDDVEYSDKLFRAKSSWNDLLEEATKRTTRRSKSQINNLQNIATNQNTPSPKKRKRDDNPPVFSNADESTATAESKTPKRQPAARCSKVGCSNTSYMKWLSFHRLPRRPANLPSNPSKKQCVDYRGKLWLRQEAMDRLGYDRNELSESMRVCNAHGIETVRKCLPVTHDAKVFSQLYEFTLIPGAGSKSSICPSHESKGVGRDRLVHRHLSSINDKAQQTPFQLGLVETEVERERRMKEEAQANEASAWMMAQQVIECSSRDASQPISPSVSIAAGLLPSKDPTDKHPRSKKLFKWSTVSSPRKKSTPSSQSLQRRTVNDNVKYNPATISDEEVKRRTGFSSINNLLAYIIIICNGDL